MFANKRLGIRNGGEIKGDNRHGKNHVADFYGRHGVKSLLLIMGDSLGGVEKQMDAR